MSNELCCEMLHNRLALGAELSDAGATELCRELCHVVSHHDIAGVWVAFFQECQQSLRTGIRQGLDG